jgi:cytochrome c-type biogenesis protein
MKDIFTTKAFWPSEDDPEKAKRSRLVLAATFIIPLVLVIGLLFVVITLEGGIQTAVADLALLLPLGTAFAAGMVASVNPCGIMMLTSYAFYQVRSEGAGSSTASRALWGLVIAVVVTLGFIVIIGLVGIGIAAGGQWLVGVFPYAGLLLGAGMMGLGVWLLVTHRTLGIVPGKGLSVAPQRSLGNAFVFGIVYAVASLSCTLPIFLAVVGTSLAIGGLVHSLGQFVGYALGMGTSIFVVVIGAALFRRGMARWLRALTPYIHRLSAMFLMGAGVYLIYYWLFIGGLAL